MNAAVDVFVLPSYEAAYPLALIEAMAAGTAMVVTAVGGTVEVIETDVSGVLLPPGDSGPLTDDVIRTQLGKQAIRQAAVRFTQARMVAETRAVYQRLLEGV